MQGSLSLQRAGQCALHAYDHVGTAFEEMGYTSVERVQNGFTAGWLASCPSHAVLATEGTVGPGTQPRSMLTWLSNLDFRQADLGGGQRVHAKWHAQTLGYLPRVLDALSNQGVTEVSLVGHSYGGAVAQLVARPLADEGILITNVYSFGAPQSGNSAWAGAFPTSEVYRVERGLDVVPWIPFSTPLWLLGLQWAAYLGASLKLPHGPVNVEYSPAGKLVWCDDTTTPPRLVTDAGELAQLRIQRMSDLLGSFSRPITSIQCAADHNVQLYADHVASQKGI